MKKIILTLSALLVASSARAAGVLINGNQINPNGNITISSFTVNGPTTITGATVLSNASLLVGGSTVTASGAWTAFTPVNNAGCAGSYVVNTARYTLLGKTMFFAIDVQCTSNSVGWNINFPFKNGASNAINTAYCNVEDNSSFVAGAGLIQANGAGSPLMTLFKDGTQTNAWTNSGTKRAICSGVFEIQ